MSTPNPNDDDDDNKKKKKNLDGVLADMAGCPKFYHL
jgi:hypothetical protein